MICCYGSDILPIDQFEFLKCIFSNSIPVSLAPLVVNIAMATETWNLLNVDLTQVCSCLALYPGSSPEKRGESLEELITYAPCDVYYVWF